MTIRTNRPRRYDITIYFHNSQNEFIQDVDEQTANTMKDQLEIWSGTETVIKFRINNDYHHINMHYYIRSKFVQK